MCAGFIVGLLWCMGNIIVDHVRQDIRYSDGPRYADISVVNQGKCPVTFRRTAVVHC